MPKPWIRVSRASPCPICQKSSWCAISGDGKTAKCMRIAVGCFKTQEDGSGLASFHRLDKPIEVKPMPEVKPKTYREIGMIYGKMEGKGRDELSKILGVSREALAAYRSGYYGISWTFPMFSSPDRMVGIRKRHRDGKQTTEPGTHNALFLPQTPLYVHDTLFVCEGPSDACALYDLGFWAIGRPSCSGGTEFIKPLVKGKHVVIVSDNDKPKKRPDGTLYYPGQTGAERLCDNLIPICRSVRIIKPARQKDIRAWYNDGCTAQDIQYLMKNTKVFTRRNALP